MQIKIEIERPCETCHESGNRYTSGALQQEIGGCPTCGGTGMEITDLGWHVLTTIARYYKLELREEVRLTAVAQMAQGRATITNPLKES